MEVTVSDQIIQVLDALCDKFGLAIDWGAQNVMPYAQELMGKMVSYELWTSLVWVVILSIIMILCAIIIKQAYKNSKNEIFLDDFDAGICMCSGLTFILCTAGVVWQTMDIITCLTFPEKIVFEMMQSMMK